MEAPADSHYDFYISYPDPQRDRAIALADVLRHAGLSVFLYADEHAGGVEREDLLVQSMHHSKTVLVVVDESTPQRDYQPKEIARALDWLRIEDGPKRVVPILCGDGGSRGLKALPELSRLHAIDWDDGESAETVAAAFLPTLSQQTSEAPPAKRHASAKKASSVGRKAKAPRPSPEPPSKKAVQREAKHLPEREADAPMSDGAPSEEARSDPQPIARIEGRSAVAVLVASGHAVTVVEAVEGVQSVTLRFGEHKTMRATVAMRDPDYGCALLALTDEVSIAPAVLSTSLPGLNTPWTIPALGDRPGGVAGHIAAAAGTLTLRMDSLGDLDAYPVPGTPIYADDQVVGLVRHASGQDATAVSSLAMASDERVRALLPAALRPAAVLRWVSVAGKTDPGEEGTRRAARVGLTLAEADPAVGLVCGGFRGVDELVARAFVEHSLRLGRAPQVMTISGGPEVAPFFGRARVVRASRHWAQEHADRVSLLLVFDSDAATAIASQAKQFGRPLLPLPLEEFGSAAEIHKAVADGWGTRAVPGLSHEDFLALADGVGQEQAERQLAAVSRALMAIGRATDRRDASGWVNDRPDGEDHLDRKTQAQLFARGIASTQMQAPFAIGLFGDWGAGKSHFIGLLKGEVKSAAKRRTGGDSMRICQIDFNAWHYMDANLWVSIAARIFGGIAEELGVGVSEDPAKTRSDLHAKLRSTKDAKADAESRTQQAQKRLAELDQELLTLKGERSKKMSTLKGALSDKKVWRAIAKELNLDEKVLAKGAARLAGGEDQLARLLAAPEEAAKLEAEVRSTTGLAKSLVSSLRPEGAGQWAIGVILVVLPLLLQWLASKFEVVDWSAANSVVAQILAVGGTVAAKARGHLDQASELLRYAESVRDRGAAVQDTVLAELSDEEKQVLAAYEEAEASVRSTATRRDELAQQIESAEHELAALDSGKLVYDFVEKKTAVDGLYRESEGVVSMVRRDLGELKSLLRGWAEDETAREPVERVVLYIDDLDRCPADRVVQVLQAVHLLLAIDDLFVVVVGVDARWLSRSLEQGYEHLLATESEAENGDAPTAEDYLQKIFQVPFTLPRIQEKGFGDLIRAHVKVPGELPKEEEVAAADSSAQANTEARDTEARDVSAGGDGSEAPAEDVDRVAEAAEATATPEPSEAESPESSQEPPPTDTGPAVKVLGRFVVEDWERTFVTDHLHPFLRTPRGIKRFINIYQLLRAGLEGGELDAFRRSDILGEHRVVSVLLAANIGFARLGAAFLRTLATPSSGAEAPSSWAEAVAALVAEPESEGTDSGVGGLARYGSPAECQALHDMLVPLGEVVSDSIEPWRRWAARVGRYSMFWGVR